MAIFPGAMATDSDLYIAVNNLSTLLTDNPLTVGATTVNVVSTTGFPTVGFISIDAEVIKYTGKTATSFTGCTRGADGTTAASHVLNSQVHHNVIAGHHNALKEEIKAIEQNLNDRIGLHATQIQATDGSAAVPSISFDTDTNTGFYSAGGNAIGVACGAANVLTINTTSVTANNVVFLQGSGSAGSPTYAFTVQTNMGMYRRGTDELGFSTAGTDFMYLNGVGTLVHRIGGESDAVDVQGTTAGTVNIRIAPNGATSNAARIRGTTNGTNTDLSFLTSALERLNIKASGELLLNGATTPRIFDGDTPILQIEGSNNSNSSFGQIRNSNTAGGPSIFLAKSRGASPGGVTIVQDNDTLGSVRFLGTDGTNILQGAVVSAAVDGTPGTNDLPTRLGFFTTPDGSASSLERVRITNAGQTQFTGGSQAVPGISFLADPDTGIYLGATDRIDFTSGNTRTLALRTTFNESLLPFHFASGTSAVPSISFDAESTLGFYRRGANDMALAGGDREAARFQNVGQGGQNSVGAFNINTGTPSTSNTARLTAQTGVGDGDAFVSLTANGTSWHMGVDVSDSNAVSFGTSGTVGNNQVARATATSGFQIKGTTTNDNATALWVGEEVRSSVAVDQNITTSATYQDITSISLTAGDWDITAQLEPSNSGATWTQAQVFVGTTAGNSSAGQVAADNSMISSWASSSTTPTRVALTIANYRVSLSATTTHYLKAFVTFSAGTPQARGRISARRRR